MNCVDINVSSITPPPPTPPTNYLFPLIAASIVTIGFLKEKFK